MHLKPTVQCRLQILKWRLRDQVGALLQVLKTLGPARRAALLAHGVVQIRVMGGKLAHGVAALAPLAEQEPGETRALVLVGTRQAEQEEEVEREEEPGEATTQVVGTFDHRYISTIRFPFFSLLLEVR